MAPLLHTVAQSPDAKTQGWKLAASLPPAGQQPKALGVAGAAAGMHLGQMLVAGGANFPDAMPWQGGVKQYLPDWWAFLPDKQGNLRLNAKGQLPFKVAYAATCTTPKGVLVAGGENENGIRTDVGLLQWQAGSKQVTITSLAPLPKALTNAMAVAAGDWLYAGGGESSQGVNASWWRLNISDDHAVWQELAPLPVAVSHAVLLSSNGKLYLLGGRAKQPDGISKLYAHCQVYDPATNRWTFAAPLPQAMAAGTGAILPGGRIILFGGDTGDTFQKVETLIAAIQAETHSDKKQELINRKNQLQQNHPGFCRTGFVYDPSTNTWTTGNSVPFATPVTAVAVPIHNRVYLVSGEIKAGVRTPDIWTIKLQSLK